MTDTGFSITPGQLLAAAREARSLTLEDISKRTRLSVQLVHDLEQNEYVQIGARTFVRGYLCTYARLVGVPEKQVLDALEASGLMPEVPDFVAPVRIEGKPIAAELRSATAGIFNRSQHSRWAIVGGVLLLVVGALFFMQDSKSVSTPKSAKAKNVATALAFSDTATVSHDVAPTHDAAPVSESSQPAVQELHSDSPQMASPAQPVVATPVESPVLAPSPSEVPVENTAPKTTVKKVRHHRKSDSSFSAPTTLHPTYTVSPVSDTSTQ